MLSEVAAQAAASTPGELTRVPPPGQTPHNRPGSFLSSVLSEQRLTNGHADFSMVHNEGQSVSHASYTSAAQNSAHEDGFECQGASIMLDPLAKNSERENGNSPPASDLISREESSPLVSVWKHQRIMRLSRRTRLVPALSDGRPKSAEPRERYRSQGGSHLCVNKQGCAIRLSHTDCNWDKFLIPCLDTRRFGTFERLIQVLAYLGEFMKNKNTLTRRSKKMKKHQYSRGVLGKQTHATRALPPNLQHGESVLCRQRPNACHFSWRKQADSNILSEAEQRSMPLGFRFSNAVAVVAVTVDRKRSKDDLESASR
ncbi:hypothetical protein AC578_7341 [Pseudocercospora eumusae]|uniref:Uncharacterized protein n=1 Tax=Pseudocercospora eumusae TaxID=321146 RepID=A0A139HWD3_9PEZI|nr:hypothetical protein AC578_7341 [Pseudocercospora eumusae]